MDARTRLVSWWLLASAALVVAMVGVGGYTRLTRSGLSIVEWNPVTGALPPLSPAAWEDAFTAYQASPEGRLVNPTMDLNGFQRIFLVEWFHRLLGRFTGLFFGVPWLAFALRGWLRRGQALRYFAWFALGGLQGGLGWFMVRSGLEQVPHVSPFRLTAHLFMALFVLSALWCEVLALRSPRLTLAPAVGWPWAPKVMGAVLVVTLAWGGLMAGHQAGWVADTFPMMNGQWVPFSLELLKPWDVVESAVVVHFVHRGLGLLVLALGVLTAVSTWKATGLERRAGAWVGALAVLQATVGVVTVLFHVPTALAVAHQVNGALLLTATVTLWYARVPRGQPVRADSPPSAAGAGVPAR